MQSPALNAESELAVDHVAVIEVHERSPLDGLRSNAPDGRAAFDRSLRYAELVELTHGGRMQDHARSACHGRIVAFKVRNAMP